MFYTHSTLDRADHLRKDDAQIESLRAHRDARLVPVWHLQTMVAKVSDTILPQALLLSADCPLPEGQTVFLGLQGTSPIFAVDVSTLDENQRDALADKSITRSGQALPGVFADLRLAGPSLPEDDGSLLAYARGLMYWNSTARFCESCGNALVSSNAGHTRTCSNHDCTFIAFPRTDPAVIMLVSHTPDGDGEPVCLLGRSPAWPEGVFSTLAGFVEAGESLENAVRREVMEEASIKVGEVRYIASQPWPFPRSIMLGFEAVATSTEINCDTLELADAQWFTRKQLAGFDNWGDESDNFKLPRKDSIARFLIDRWMKDANH
ncbi:NADH pyrophosphatase [Granulosicoccus antarcticus IMCC3135]|uniref:NAD(+) diphosphatase n=2 Tax=Granulosicoccus TaxID=437504 RepID=A0A2Z2P179_9GAMM|nr:NADH pyrophosphatase [Granulosicoccus antarcticus IMCC3135]